MSRVVGKELVYGDLAAPTYDPSILVTYHDEKRCHSFIRAGVWEFLGDSTHSLAGQSHPMVDCPDWVDA